MNSFLFAISIFIITLFLCVCSVIPLNASWVNMFEETTCRVDSVSVQHFLFRDIPQQEFVVGLTNKWDVLRPKETARHGEIKSLSADNPRGPQIIERGNAIGWTSCSFIHFSIDCVDCCLLLCLFLCDCAILNH